MKHIHFITILLVFCFSGLGLSQNKVGGKFGSAKSDIETQLKESMTELSSLREAIFAEKVPLSKKLAKLEASLSQVRQKYQDTTRDLDGRNIDLSNLRRKIKNKKDQAHYLSNLLADYMRGFEAKLHISELKRFEIDLESAKNALEDDGMEKNRLYLSQIGLVNLSLTRLEGALGGDIFEGTAVDENGVVAQGTFAVLGPIAIFRSHDGSVVGWSDQKLGSLEPSAVPFSNTADSEAAANLLLSKAGEIPLDPTMGNAHKIESTQETFLEHVKKGGTVMYPIFGMASIALLIAIYKWLSFLFLRKPSKKRLNLLLDTVAAGDFPQAVEQAGKLKGPVGRMLAAGTKYLDEPRELIEEVMYESVLTTESKLQSLLPFLAVCAASAPLLGLLGTVTGIINTFKMITVFGSGDVKSLSGGISEALITTKFGLIVAIPSLLLHAFLSRKAKRVVTQMETAGVAFINRVGLGKTSEPATDTNVQLVKEQVNEVLSSIVGSSSATESELSQSGN